MQNYLYCVVSLYHIHASHIHPLKAAGNKHYSLTLLEVCTSAGICFKNEVERVLS